MNKERPGGLDRADQYIKGVKMCIHGIDTKQIIAQRYI